MIGIDEVGRGCWAGPLLVVAARQLSPLPTGIKDSKLLSKKRRTAFRFDIEVACDIGEGWVTVDEVDELGLTDAMRLGVSRALEALGATNDEEIIMDGSINYCAPVYQQVQAVVGADASYPIVSAASVYAKVLRDTYMEHQATLFPDYGFEKHVGYGTAVHKKAIESSGLTPLHRRSFAPIRAFLSEQVHD